MRILAVTNLYPRPDQPRRGLFNAEFFSALAQQGVEVTNLVLVPDWRPWRWSIIRHWSRRSAQGSVRIGAHGTTSENPLPGGVVRPAGADRGGFPSALDPPPSHARHSLGEGGTFYLPVPHLPLIGRNMAWRLHARALRRHRALFEACDVVLATWLYPDAVAADLTWPHAANQTLALLRDSIDSRPPMTNVTSG